MKKFSQILQGIRFKTPLGNIVKNCQMHRINDMPAIDVVTSIIYRAFRSRKTGIAAPGCAAVTSKGKFHPIPFGTSFQIGQIKPEKIVAFDHIRIPFRNNFDKFFQQIAFPEIFLRQDTLKTVAVRNGNNNNFIAWAVSIGKFIPFRRQSFDVDLHAAQFRETHSSKKPQRCRKQCRLNRIAKQFIISAASVLFQKLCRIVGCRNVWKKNRCLQ